MQLPSHTKYRPTAPLLIWDGQCGFCKYWVTWLEQLTEKSVLYSPYQQIHQAIEEIPKNAFKKAVRLIDTNGEIYSGAGAAYKIFEKTSTWSFLISWYKNNSLFRGFSDFVYRFVSNHRSALLTITKFLFGKNPTKLQHFWIIYLVLFLFAVILIVKLIPS
ncbi:MAG TPA: thiol-disulfide oxidoreductase [Muricauda sp.]|nr:thiol-disulfide oxidoreductase [Allomuricauda sp.]MBC72629.1 thiol-disulfide oxidoreductase [Allomuricauda sp.]HBU77745.1 thiol-disulfide oxidoreductase [Allomuricauda sp.]|tara:strand:+ start:337 stop:819 length:483 start_codon:yes stop_codon:yes gene_type:complete